MSMPDQWCAIRLSALGDVVLCTGVLLRLHQELGLAFTVFTRKGFGPVFENHPAVAEVEFVDEHVVSLGSWLGFCRTMAGEHQGEGLLDLHGTLRSRILSLFWKGPVRRYPKFGLARRWLALAGPKRAAGTLARLRALSVPQRYSMALPVDGLNAPDSLDIAPVAFLTPEELREGRRLADQARARGRIAGREGGSGVEACSGGKPVGDKPVGDKPVGDKPVGDKPVGDGSIEGVPVWERTAQGCQAGGQQADDGRAGGTLKGCPQAVAAGAEPGATEGEAHGEGVDRPGCRERKLAVLHPFATHPAKAWPMDRWRELADMLDSAGWDWCFIGRDNGDHPAWFRDLPESRNLVNALTLRQSMALMAAADVVATGDSGPLHLARAVKTPVAALFGPTDRAWGFYPHAAEGRVVEHPLDCRPCSLHGAKRCPRNLACMAGITPEEVFRAMGEAATSSE